MKKEVFEKEFELHGWNDHGVGSLTICGSDCQASVGGNHNCDAVTRKGQHGGRYDAVLEVADRFLRRKATISELRAAVKAAKYEKALGMSPAQAEEQWENLSSELEERKVGGHELYDLQSEVRNLGVIMAEIDKDFGE